MTTEDNGEVFVEREYVFGGKRMGDKNKVFVAIYLINEDGTLAKAQHYEHNKSRNKVVGGIYKGAKFSESRVRGLDDAKYDRRWNIQADRIMWDAEHERAEVEIRRSKMEKDAGRISDLEQILLPLRKQYEALRYKRDYAGQEAFEAAVLRALKCAPRAIE
jgi:hypothetical protein